MIDPKTVSTEGRKGTTVVEIQEVRLVCSVYTRVLSRTCVCVCVTVVVVTVVEVWRVGKLGQ